MLSSVMRAIGWISNIEGNAFLIKGRCYCGFYFFCNLTSILLRWLFFWLFDWRLRSTSIKHFPFFTVCAGLGLPQVRVRDGTVNSLKKNYNKYASSFFFQKLCVLYWWKLTMSLNLILLIMYLQSGAAKSRTWAGPSLFFWNDNPPQPRIYHGFASINEYHFVFGGYCSAGWDPKIQIRSDLELTKRVQVISTIYTYLT